MVTALQPIQLSRLNNPGCTAANPLQPISRLNCSRLEDIVTASDPSCTVQSLQQCMFHCQPILSSTSSTSSRLHCPDCCAVGKSSITVALHCCTVLIVVQRIKVQSRLHCTVTLQPNPGFTAANPVAKSIFALPSNLGCIVIHGSRFNHYQLA